MMLYITKRNGEREMFSVEKIRAAILKAFNSCKVAIDANGLNALMAKIVVKDGMTVEDIQNQVEVALMKGEYFDVAKAFMLYREQHREDREVASHLRFLMDYMNSANAATGSKYDANANVENKNIATLIGELPKKNFIRLNRRLLTDRIKEM